MSQHKHMRCRGALHFISYQVSRYAVFVVTHGYGSRVHGAGRQCVQRSLPY